MERAILEGDSETGVCLMEVEAGLDTGPVYAEADTEIDEEETADELRSRLVVLGCQLLVEYLAGGLRGLPMPQDQKGEPSYAEKVLPAELEIRWDQPAVQIRRVIRLGRAWTTFRGERLRVLDALARPVTAPGETETGPPGTLEGSAVHTATEQVLARAKEIAASHLEASVDDIVVQDDGRVGVAGVPARACGSATG